jgi:internalin A
LLEKLEALVEAEQRRIGIACASAATAARRTRPPAEAAVEPKGPHAAPPLRFVQERSAQPEYFVSYAWGDNTAEGVARERIVDQMCAAAGRRGITILRDKKVLGLGDRISKFMQRIGRGDRIFVVLSDKYLKSPFCMFELSEVWRRCAEEDEAFLKRIRVYTLPDAKIWTPLDRARCAAHWKKESAELEAFLKEEGIEILGEKDFEICPSGQRHPGHDS